MKITGCGCLIKNSNREKTIGRTVEVGKGGGTVKLSETQFNSLKDRIGGYPLMSGNYPVIGAPTEQQLSVGGFCHLFVRQHGNGINYYLQIINKR